MSAVTLERIHNLEYLVVLRSEQLRTIRTRHEQLLQARESVTGPIVSKLRNRSRRRQLTKIPQIAGFSAQLRHS